jgi:cyclophilin family peptidyl-prolyl cis-trans isomerase
VKQWQKAPGMQIDAEKSYTAVLKTGKGEIEVELLSKEAPQTVNNFVFLAKEGFYDGVPFHRVIQAFMIQTGDPTGTGSGGPGYRFADELPPRQSYQAGMVAMANAGPNTNGSQFFICSGRQSTNLDSSPNYTQFGRVVKGMDVVAALAATPVTRAPHGEVSKPTERIQIDSVEIREA